MAVERVLGKKARPEPYVLISLIIKFHKKFDIFQILKSKFDGSVGIEN